MKAIVLISVATGEVHEVVKDIRRLHSVSEVHAAFGPYDVIAELQADDLDRLGKIVAREIQPIPGVERTVTCLQAEGNLPLPVADVAVLAQN
jgi:DNA-binding Lrp family transcriptional regulator